VAQNYGSVLDYKLLQGGSSGDRVRPDACQLLTLTCGRWLLLRAVFSSYQMPVECHGVVGLFDSRFAPKPRLY